MPARQNRVTRGDDYRRIVRSGHRVGDARSVVYAVFHSDQDEQRAGSARFGFIVSKAVGNAVVRNLVRRRLKTIADRQLLSGLTGVDIVIRALPQAATAGFAELESEIERSLVRVKRKHEVRA